MPTVFFSLHGIVPHASFPEFHRKMLWDVFPELQTTALITQDRKHWLKDVKSIANIKFEGPQSLLALASTFLPFKKHVRMIFDPYKQIADPNDLGFYMCLIQPEGDSLNWVGSKRFIYRGEQPWIRDKHFDATFNPKRIPKWESGDCIWTMQPPDEDYTKWNEAYTNWNLRREQINKKKNNKVILPCPEKINYYTTEYLSMPPPTKNNECKVNFLFC
jgi:hypothetical protein